MEFNFSKSGVSKFEFRRRNDGYLYSLTEIKIKEGEIKRIVVWFNKSDNIL